MNRLLCSFRLPSLLLAAALQILPFVRAALPAAQTATNLIAVVFRWAAGATVALGSLHAVSGASTVITSPLTAKGTNGVPFSLRLTTAPEQAHVWTATGLPPGLTLFGTVGSALWRIQGTPAEAGVFDVRLTAKDTPTSNAERTVSATLKLTIVAVGSPPGIVTAPTNLTVTAGQDVSFVVAASGTAPLSYQWRFKGAPLTNQTAATLTLSAVTPDQAGSYDVVVSNPVGSVTSAPAVLTVNPAPVTPVLTVAVLPDGPLVARFTATVGASYVIEQSADFVGWQPVQTVGPVTASGPVSVQVPTLSLEVGFLRVRLLP